MEDVIMENNEMENNAMENNEMDLNVEGKQNEGWKPDTKSVVLGVVIGAVGLYVGQKAVLLYKGYKMAKAAEQVVQSYTQAQGQQEAQS
jgi:hypothetical protein